MAERLTMARLCLRPALHHCPPTRRHFCPPPPSVLGILRHLSSGLKSRRARQRGTSLTFIIYDRYFSQARAHTPGSERAQSGRRIVAATSFNVIDAPAEERLKNSLIYGIRVAALRVWPFSPSRIIEALRLEKSLSSMRFESQEIMSR